MKRTLTLAFCLLASSFLGGAARAADWPALNDQLAKDQVAAGSALETLIRANQDFSVLRPDELKENRPELPPWIKVWWRKAHPEATYSAADPTGGYPLVLREIHEWMLSHQDLRPGPGEPDGYDPEDRTSVSGEMRISGAQTTPRSESDIRVNYWDPTKIISASNSITGGGHQSQFFSTDGGASWGQTTLPFFSGDTSHSDPTVDWTSDGTAWSSTLGIVGGTLRMRNYKSADNGATWVTEATVSGSQTNVDKQMVWVDHSDTSPCANFQFAIWHNGTPAFMNRRNVTPDIAGGTWLAAPIQVSGAESTGTAIGSDVKSNSFGDAFGFWPTTTNRKVFVVKSTNCGTSWGTPVQVGSTFDGFDIGVPSFNNRRALIYISGGAYRTVSKNLVYATWTDLSGETGCTAAANEPGANVASTCKTRVWFNRSTDGGATWEAARMVNNQASLNDQFNQWMVVDETTGALGLMYYDTVGDAGRKKVDVWYQSSFNDGVSWFPAVKVTTAQTDETAGGQDSGNQFGDYNGLSGYAGNFFPSWTDRRGGAKEEIWTAKVADAACTPPGAPAIGTATPTAPNQIQVTWGNGAPPATTFNVYRAVGTCAAPGPFTQVGSALAGSPFVDNAVSGSITYAYRTTGKDATGNCESANSSCVEATATGVCTLPATFAGATSVTNQELATCGLTVNWAAGTAQCAGPLTYKVYRDTVSNFTPAPANLIASGQSGTSYSDVSPGLVNGATYYYVVRAVDSSNSVEDTNLVRRNAFPSGPVTPGNLVETFEAGGPGGFDNPGWTHQAISGANDWTISIAQSQTPTHSWSSVSLPSVSERVLVSPQFGGLAGTTLSFWHTFAFESPTTCFDGGTLEASTDGGTVWTVLPDASFTAGGFNGTVSAGFSNPIGGKRAWCNGTIGPMTQVTANLGSFAGQNVKLRWHEGDDSSTIATGWFVDSVTINNAGTAASCTSGGPPPALPSDGFESGGTCDWDARVGSAESCPL